MTKKRQTKELPTATDKNPGFTVKNDTHQPLAMLIEQTDSGLDMERSDLHADNEDM
ncbi:hypothetical protein [Alkalihalobacillus sp. AL-G]|uniref:hypothetical protein n=1 Tax=Alkalihalobacillus sp. AL-G TaxID=2926399 RepID=UPI00272B57FE|nr:hypothetical protein [Alkalihalobacillus sp. AL-G]WLD92887.1 hypothetical protein MOJ78_18065 [Alkalihalobacillus sp. AL-G]